MVGDCDLGYRIMLSSGYGRSTRIEFGVWDSINKIWKDVGTYYPKFCPNCGRLLYEYD